MNLVKLCRLPYREVKWRVEHNVYQPCFSRYVDENWPYSGMYDKRYRMSREIDTLLDRISWPIRRVYKHTPIISPHENPSTGIQHI